MRTYILLAAMSVLASPILAQSACKCCTEQHRQFDFWVGDWEVFTSDGSLLGTNTIEIIQDSCLIRENWSSATSGFTGTSYNYFDSGQSEWMQVWVDNQGTSLLLRGGVENGNMVLTGDPFVNAQGQSTVNRITWTPNADATVRQLWEVRIDDGEWGVAFDGMYRKVEDNN